MSVPDHFPEDLNRKARYEGIDQVDVVREGLIEMRGRLLKVNRFNDALLLTHAIWWMSTLAKEVADAPRG